jgi:predicted enzyme related to lactoylglutathione lyase
VFLAPNRGATTKETPMSNPFTYAELHTQNPTAAKHFYSRLLDWKMSDHENPQGTYTEIDPGEGFPGGMLKLAGPVAASHWLPYVKVADVEGATARAKALGASPVQELVEIPEGVFSVLIDPTGAPFGLFQTSKR